MDEFEVCWEDGTIWDISWFEDGGCFLAQRWFPDGDDDGACGPFIETPGPELGTVEDLDTLEAVMGRALPGQVREELELEALRYPFTDEMRRDWRVESAIGITRLHPVAGWIDTFAPPGHPNPFADHWLPEAVAWSLEKLLGSATEPGLDDRHG